MTKLRVGLIGCGAIGMDVARMLALADWAHPCGALVRQGSRALANPPATGLPMFTDLDALLATQPRIVVECAGHEAVDAYSQRILEAGCDLMVVSVGALGSSRRYDRLADSARTNGHRIIIPAGAVGGLDFLQAAGLAGLSRVSYRSRKPPAAWRGTPAEATVDLDAMSAACTFYRGNAREAATMFPKNANVAATIALATLGLDETRVELMADPQADGNYHEIEAAGAAGTISLRIQARVSPQNPSTSMITAYSVMHALRRECSAMVI